MIADLFFYVMSQWIEAIILSLPDGAADSRVADAIAVFMATVSRWDSVFPVSTLLIIVSLVLVVEGVILSFRVSYAIARFIRGAG